MLCSGGRLRNRIAHANFQAGGFVCAPKEYRVAAALHRAAIARVECVAERRALLGEALVAATLFYRHSLRMEKTRDAPSECRRAAGDYPEKSHQMARALKIRTDALRRLRDWDAVLTDAEAVLEISREAAAQAPSAETDIAIVAWLGAASPRYATKAWRTGDVVDL